MPLRNLELDIELTGAFHAGSGYAIAGRVDRSIVRDLAGRPFLPGSTLKGKLRHAAREIAHAFDQGVCDSGRVCLPVEQPPPCILCRLFGSPFRAGTVFVSDACVENGDLTLPTGPPLVWGERMGVGINRRTRTAQPNLLYSSECAGAIRLKAVIQGDIDDAGLQLLRGAAKALAFLGGGSSRGLGRCVCRIP